MGKGLTRAFKDNYPKHYEFYRKRCDDGSFKIGTN
jgi:hypothetical protein